VWTTTPGFFPLRWESCKLFLPEQAWNLLIIASCAA
jgi:hypothetical protein